MDGDLAMAFPSLLSPTLPLFYLDYLPPASATSPAQANLMPRAERPGRNGEGKYVTAVRSSVGREGCLKQKYFKKWIPKVFFPVRPDGSFSPHPKTGRRCSWRLPPANLKEPGRKTKGPKLLFNTNGQRRELFKGCSFTAAV